MAPIHTAAKQGDLEGVKRALADGADVDGKDSGGNAPLIWATYSGNLEVLTLLLQRGADTAVLYKQGWSCLHIASRENKPDVARTLLQFGADLHARNASGRTPVELAGSDAMRSLLSPRAPDESAADDLRRRYVADGQRAAEEALALRAADAALQRSRAADAAPAQQAPPADPAAAAQAARRKAAAEADVHRREALEEADLARALGEKSASDRGLATSASAADVAQLQAKVAAQLRAAQAQVASRRGEPAGRPAGRTAASMSAGNLTALQLPPVRTAPAVMATTEAERRRGVLAAVAGAQQPDSPATASRRALLSPKEAAERILAAQAAAAQPPPMQELLRLRRAAEESHRQAGTRQSRDRDVTPPWDADSERSRDLASDVLTPARRRAAQQSPLPSPPTASPDSEVLARLRRIAVKPDDDGAGPRVAAVLPPPPPLSPTPMRRPWEPQQPEERGFVPVKPSPSKPAGSSGGLSAFMAYLFGETDDEDGNGNTKGRARLCCAMPRVPSMMAAADDDDEDD